jgi:hypothetical protein
MLVTVDDHIKNPSKLRSMNLINWVTSGLCLVGLFAGFIYPKIRPSVGGGAPTAVELQFGEKSPLGTPMRSRVWLIDENNNGFYILRAPNDKKAVYVPRGSVSAVYYGQ